MYMNFEACPICGSVVVHHEPADEWECETIIFNCGGEIYYDDKYELMHCVEECGSRSQSLTYYCEEQNQSHEHG